MTFLETVIPASMLMHDNNDEVFPFSHGTRCAGEVSAARDNGVCGVGIAYDSLVAGKGCAGMFVATFANIQVCFCFPFYISRCVCVFVSSESAMPSAFRKPKLPPKTHKLRLNDPYTNRWQISITWYT